MTYEEATATAEKIRLYWKGLGYRVNPRVTHDEDLDDWMVRSNMVNGWPSDIGAPQKRRIAKDIRQSIPLPRAQKDRVVA